MCCYCLLNLGHVNMNNVPKSLEEIIEENYNAPFPKYALSQCETALMLFCAGFYGRNDCVWVAEAGLTNVVCIDTDQEKLDVMRKLYPVKWSFVCTDVYKVQLYEKYDLVVADIPLGQFEESRNWYSKWCNLAIKYVLVAADPNQIINAGLLPRDWKVKATIMRTDISCWLFLCKR